ncbi:ATP-binding cassette domain-containing protein [Streptacidiphilus sp. PB12-B1b]|uniref:ATP-binding cassette domain-containing protein n=1 Tax=Streptacidiphilus sp. PB12-B1b TaxID=2705012 RepID=UPI0015FB39A0|nr:ATP-binding cassette domain-containing protein [Streptacidiphilus sp. PB12-B1b]QMU80474.1 ATP-binding cassette domain-containing protein [Streptacidiphilus sp. PB12-B1b]
MVEVSELSKRYGGRLAVDNLSFTLRPGKVTGFLGPNGAGKSTTMRLILGLDRPDHGRATIGGRGYAQLVNPLRTVGALLEAKAVHKGRTARNHLRYLAATQGLPLSRVDRVLEQVGLGDAGRRRAGGFSLGMGQRLGIAAVLLGDPQILMLDEPVNGLDPEGVLWIRNLMKSLADEGRTVFVSSHMMNEMAVTADHLVVIGRGRLLADCPTAEFIERNSQSAVLVRTTEPDRLARLLDSAGAEAVGDGGSLLTVTGLDTARIAALAASQRIAIHELTTQRASLEEAFMHLTRDSVEYTDTHTPSRSAA